MNQFNRYSALVFHLAGQTLAAAEKARDALSPNRPAANRRAAPLTLALPAARMLLDPPQTHADTHHSPLRDAAAALAPLEPDSDPCAARLVTLLDQSRTIYHPLAVYLLLKALHRQGPAIEPAARQAIERDLARAVDTIAQCHARTPRSRDRFALLLWQALCLVQAAHALPDTPRHQAAGQEALDAVNQLLEQFQSDGPLHPRDANDQLDAWTYRELAAAHALSHLARPAGESALQQRVVDVARYHLQCTQPDYTTYEPWGMPAFAQVPDTLIFVDQQLHDVSTNVHLSGDASALVPALLLADTACAMRQVQQCK